MMKRAWLVFTVCLCPTTAAAQQGEIAPTALGKKVLDESAATEADDDAPEAESNWQFALNVGGNGAYTNSSDVVGQLDGATVALGLVLDGRAEWVSGQHSVENDLKIQHSQTSAPPIDEFIKSADQLDIATTYLYRLAALPWLGPYVRAKLTTAVLPGRALFAEEIEFVGGPKPGRQPAQTEVLLTSAFEPLTLFQSAGVFARPIDTKLLAADAKIGGGAQQIYTQGGYVAEDEPKAPAEGGTKIYTLTQLHDSLARGAEFEVAAAGSLTTSLSYGAKLNLFLPLEGPKLTGVEGLQTTAEAKLSIKLSKWASLDFVHTRKKIPAIQGKDADFQVQNALMVTAGFNLL